MAKSSVVFSKKASLQREICQGLTGWKEIYWNIPHLVTFKHFMFAFLGTYDYKKKLKV